MKKERICDRPEAMKVIILSFRIGSPHVWFGWLLCIQSGGKHFFGKYKSQATQHGHILSHIDAYNGEEKTHMEKERICNCREAMKVIIFSFHIRSPQVWFTHIVRPE